MSNFPHELNCPGGGFGSWGKIDTNYFWTGTLIKCRDYSALSHLRMVQNAVLAKWENRSSQIGTDELQTFFNRMFNSASTRLGSAGLGPNSVFRCVLFCFSFCFVFGGPGGGLGGPGGGFLLNSLSSGFATTFTTD